VDDKTIIHYGLNVKIKTRGYKLTRENYAIVSDKSSIGKNMFYMQALKENNEKLIKSYSEIYVDKEGLVYRDDWCKKHLIEVMHVNKLIIALTL